MLTLTRNPFRGRGIWPDAIMPRADNSAVASLLALCPKHASTPLHVHADLARRCGVEAVYIKDESQRMGLGSFKALGAAFVIAKDAEEAGAASWEVALKGRTYVAASAGNHGLSVAAGAALFGAKAVIYLADTVPEDFATRLRAKGAEVVRAGAIYEESMDAATKAAKDNGWTLLSDSTWEGYVDLPLRVMEGYVQLAAETVSQVSEPPTHILLQAGVGGMATALAAHFRSVWGDDPTIIVVEPEAAPALHHSILEGDIVTADGPVSSMGRLDCKTPSIVALSGLSRDADGFLTIGDDAVARGVEILNEYGLCTTPSGGAGLAAAIEGIPGLTTSARVLAILSEGAEDAA